MISSKPSHNKKEKNKSRQNKKIKIICNCSRIIDLDIGERLFINVFFSIFLFSTNFSAFLLLTTCLLLGRYFSPLHNILKVLNTLQSGDDLGLTKAQKPNSYMAALASL